MERQDIGHGSPGADRNPQHPRHAEASAIATERPPDENGRRVTTQKTSLQRCRYGAHISLLIACYPHHRNHKHRRHQVYHHQRWGISPFRENSLLQGSVQTIEENVDEDLSGNFQQRDSLVIITELQVPFLLVKMNDGRVFGILRNLSLVPHLLEERCELVHQWVSPMRVNLSRARAHARLPIGGGGKDDGTLVENALDMLQSSRQDSHLRSEQRPAIGTEKRGGAFDGRSVYSLGGG
ncbi:unnamed protein product [Schistocephalus solidus]|uniref:CBS domain-containing protein n=1 Tax=Schistocephalus solidus TaxID=70667 RepID=A0A183SAP1_SCHSO|nr:unnamed protein product [Schistocephalus solidus]